MLSRHPHGPMNGPRAGTADRAKAAGIVSAEPPPDERGDSTGPQVHYRRGARAFRPRTASRRGRQHRRLWRDLCAQPMTSKLIWW